MKTDISFIPQFNSIIPPIFNLDHRNDFDAMKSNIYISQGSRVQSLIFDTKTFTVEEAKKWALNHGFKVDKIDIPRSGETIRIRQEDPTRFKRFRIKNLDTGVRAVIGFVSSAAFFASFVDNKYENDNNSPILRWKNKTSVKQDKYLVRESDGWHVASTIISKFQHGQDLLYFSFPFASVGVNGRGLKFTHEFLKQNHHTMVLRPLLAAFVSGKPQGHGEHPGDPQPKALGVIYASKFDGEQAWAAAALWAHRFRDDISQLLAYKEREGDLAVSMELWSPKEDRIVDEFGHIVPVRGSFLATAIVGEGADPKARSAEIVTRPIEFLAASMSAEEGGIFVDIEVVKQAQDLGELAACLEAAMSSVTEIADAQRLAFAAKERILELHAAINQTSQQIAHEFESRIQKMEEELANYKSEDLKRQRINRLVPACFATAAEIPEDLITQLASMTEEAFLAKENELLKERLTVVSKTISEQENKHSASAKGASLSEEHSTVIKGVDSAIAKVRQIRARRASEYFTT